MVHPAIPFTVASQFALGILPTIHSPSQVPGEGEVRLEWRSSDVMAAREALALRVSGVYGPGGSTGSPQEGPGLAGRAVSAVASAKFVERVTWLEITRVGTSEKLELGNLPFTASHLVSMKALRLVGEDMRLGEG